MARVWHATTAEEAASELGVDREVGLLPRVAQRRLARHGPNRIITRTGSSFWSILASGLKDPMVLMLLVATALSVYMGELVDALVIAAIVCMNAFLGAFQEFRAERTLMALESMAPPSAWVRRGGRVMEIPKETVVPGDVFLLWPGMRVPADGRLAAASSLQVEEAALSGESLPVSKRAEGALPERTPLPDRKNMVFGGTLVTRGEGYAIATATGMDTEMGRIARLVSTATEGPTPLGRKLESLGKVILVASLGICCFLTVFGIIRGVPVHKMLLVGVSLAVAAVPEGLPAVVTLCFALGVQRMAKRGAVVRKLEAIETLGSVTVICTDKTGTLTMNRLEVADIGLPEDALGVPRDEKESQRKCRDLVQVAVLASDARNLPTEEAQAGEDPTEQAIILEAHRLLLPIDTIDSMFPRIHEEPFTSERRMMSVTVKDGAKTRRCYKGAPDTVIPMCRAQVMGGKESPMTQEDRAAWDAWVTKRAGRGMRVLAVARATDTGAPVLLGCLAMTDALRAESASAVLTCKRAGIRPVLVTGDHLRTAESVARQVGILAPDEGGMTGEDLGLLGDRLLMDVVGRKNVFARVSPADKIRIVRAVKARGDVVAMTGDGVNDAPALKEASVGIAMGAGGTDVAREASSVVLLDDNFQSIVSAVREGRTIYDNVRKFIRYLLSCNIGEVITMLVAALAGLPMPLGPTELLWMNLVTDGLPALALGMDPPTPDVMERPPRDPGEGVFARGLLGMIVKRGIYVGVATLIIFISALGRGDPRAASTMAYATLVTIQLVAAFDCRSETQSGAELGFFGNKYLVGAAALSWLMLAATIHLPQVAVLFDTVPLSLSQWMLIFLASIFPDLFRAAFGARK